MNTYKCMIHLMNKYQKWEMYISEVYIYTQIISF